MVRRTGFALGDLETNGLDMSFVVSVDEVGVVLAFITPSGARIMPRETDRALFLNPFARQIIHTHDRHERVLSVELVFFIIILYYTVLCIVQP